MRIKIYILYMKYIMKYIMKYKTKKKIVFLLIFLFLGIIIMNSVVRKEGLSVGSATATAVNPTPPPRPPPRPTTKAGCQRAHPDWIPYYVYFLKTNPGVDTTNMCNKLLPGEFWFQKDYPGKPGELNHTCCGTPPTDGICRLRNDTHNTLVKKRDCNPKIISRSCFNELGAGWKDKCNAGLPNHTCCVKGG